MTARYKAHHDGHRQQSTNHDPLRRSAATTARNQTPTAQATADTPDDDRRLEVTLLSESSQGIAKTQLSNLTFAILGLTRFVGQHDQGVRVRKVASNRRGSVQGWTGCSLPDPLLADLGCNGPRDLLRSTQSNVRLY
jgi:hypothetical protein